MPGWRDELLMQEGDAPLVDNNVRWTDEDKVDIAAPAVDPSFARFEEQERDADPELITMPFAAVAAAKAADAAAYIGDTAAIEAARAKEREFAGATSGDEPAAKKPKSHSKCNSACSGEAKLLSKSEMETALAELPEWLLKKCVLRREWTFKYFKLFCFFYPSAMLVLCSKDLR